MKKTILLSFAAIVAAMTSCNKVEQPAVGADAQGETIQLTANTTIGDQTKITMGAKSGQVYPMAWDAAECTYMRESGTTDESVKHYGSTSFNKADAHSGNFKFTVDANPGQTEYNYVAVYPCNQENYKTNLYHGVRYGGSDLKNRVSYILNHNENQVPAADGPDQTTHIYMAKDMGHKTQATELNFNFKPVVGYGKMTVKKFPALTAGETVSKITITAPATKIMTGRVFRYFRATETCAVDSVVAYSAGNVKPYVMIDPKNITFNTTGFDVWFTTLPLTLNKDDVLSLKVETSDSTYTANIALSKELKFQAGVVSEFVYDYEKGQPKKETKTLTFDFSTCPAGWPSGKDEYKSTDHSARTLPYVLDKVTYNFSAEVCLDLAATSTRSIAWGYDGTSEQTYFVSQPERFFGLPAIAGWKLITVKFTQACENNNSRKVCITSAVTNQKQQSTAVVVGGEAKTVKTQGTEYVFNLTGTAANTRYYWAPTAKGNGFATMTLVYEKVDQ